MVKLTVNLTDEAAEALAGLAKRENISETDVVNVALLRWVAEPALALGVKVSFRLPRDVGPGGGS